MRVGQYHRLPRKLKRLNSRKNIKMEAWFYIILALVSFIYFVQRLSKHRKYMYPPGPKGWPLLGNIFDVDVSNLHLTFTEMAKIYGDIFRVNFLGMNVIVLNSPESIKHAFTSDALADVYAGRPKSFIGTYTIVSRGTVFQTATPVWYKGRKLLHKILKMYGEGVRDQEAVVKSELNHVIKRLGEGEQPLTLEDVFLPSLFNVMTITVIGKRFDYHDERLQTAIKLHTLSNEMATVGYDVTMMLFPFLRHFPLGFGRYYQQLQKLIKIYCRHYIDAPKSTFDPTVSRGLLDVLLKLQQDDLRENGRSWLEDEDIQGIVYTTIGAGILTSGGALLSFFLTILHRPEVARQVQHEIDNVIGPDKQPELGNRPNMPYTEACILETLRFISHAPLAVPHCTIEDSTIRQFVLPKNTMVLANLWAVHHDESLWGDPWEFRPERFLDDCGHLLPPEHPNRRNMMAFGVGRRACVAEGFSKARLFLYITSLLQRFHFKYPDGPETLPPMDPRQFPPCMVLSPSRCRVLAVPR